MGGSRGVGIVINGGSAAFILTPCKLGPLDWDPKFGQEPAVFGRGVARARNASNS